MQIQLDIINKNGLDEAIGTRFSVGGAPKVIGRARKADWILPDASRFLSSEHCRVSRTGNGFEIVVLSANGVVHNGKSLGAGKSARLAGGDQLEIGPYIMLVSLSPDSADAAENTVLLERRTEPANEKTVILRAPRSAQPSAKPSVALTDNSEPIWTVADPKVFGKIPASRSAPSPNSLGVDFVRAFAAGAKVDPELLAGRNDLEFSGELGGAMQRAMHGLAALSHSAAELRTLVGSEEMYGKSPLGDTPPDSAGGGQILTVLFGTEGPGYRRAEQVIGDVADDLRAHDLAMIHAMQAALFRLLNELSPISIEAETGASILRSRRAKNWDRYIAKWENLSIARENGMLDVFLDYFREAYDNRMRGH